MDRSLVNEIKTKVEQGRYPIDLDIVTAKKCLKALEKLEADSMNINNHLLLDTLEQMREILSSPDIASRADEVFLTQAIKEFYSLIDEYAVAQSSDIDAPEDPEKIKEILGQLTSKIDVLKTRYYRNLNKLSFLSKVTPKN